MKSEVIRRVNDVVDERPVTPPLRHTIGPVANGSPSTGPYLNGSSPNGSPSTGPYLNGSSPNGSSPSGPYSNGSNGIGLQSNGQHTNGSNGIGLQSNGSNGNGSNGIGLQSNGSNGSGSNGNGSNGTGATPSIADRFTDLLAPLSNRRRRGLIARLSVGYYEGWRPSRAEITELVAEELRRSPR